MAVWKMIQLKSELYDRLSAEFPHLDSGLQSLLQFIVGYVSCLYGRTITITTVYRTQAEQDETYSDNADYRKHPWKSYHQFYQAVDIRFSPLTELQWKGLETSCKILFPHLKVKFVIHPPGGKYAPHVHVEVQRNYQEVLAYVRENTDPTA